MATATFTLQHDYPCRLSRLWATLGRRDYIEAKYSSLGATALRLLRLAVADDEIAVELERDAPVGRDGLPAWARRLLGERQTIRQASRWRRVAAGRIEATLDITPPPLPVRAHGSGSVLELDAARSRLALRFEVTCGIPALGREVACLFAGQVQRALDADHALTLRYLAAAGGGRPAALNRRA